MDRDDALDYPMLYEKALAEIERLDKIEVQFLALKEERVRWRADNEMLTHDNERLRAALLKIANCEVSWGKMNALARRTLGAYVQQIDSEVERLRTAASDVLANYDSKWGSDEPFEQAIDRLRAAVALVQSLDKLVEGITEENRHGEFGVDPKDVQSTCNYPDCDGGHATGYCHNDCRADPKSLPCKTCSGTRLVPVPGSYFRGAPVELPCPDCPSEWTLGVDPQQVDDPK